MERKEWLLDVFATTPGGERRVGGIAFIGECDLRPSI